VRFETLWKHHASKVQLLRLCPSLLVYVCALPIVVAAAPRNYTGKVQRLPAEAIRAAFLVFRHANQPDISPPDRTQ
jgi:ribosome biogenesis protein Tsr3